MHSSAVFYYSRPCTREKSNNINISPFSRIDNAIDAAVNGGYFTDQWPTNEPTTSHKTNGISFIHHHIVKLSCRCRPSIVVSLGGIVVDYYPTFTLSVSVCHWYSATVCFDHITALSSTQFSGMDGSEWVFSRA